MFTLDKKFEKLPQELLENLQGNILKFHGRKYGFYLFIKFTKFQQQEVKKWIRELADRKITSAYRQVQDGKRRAVEPGFDGGLFVTLGLSYKGYTYLELRSIPSDYAFMKGMKKRARLLGDKKPSTESAYSDTIHAVLFIADDNREALNKYKKKLEKQLRKRKIGRILAAEQASVGKKDGKARLVDGFGFVHGLSSPVFTKDALKKYESQQKEASKVKNPLKTFNPYAHPEQLLVNDELTTLPCTYGSYLVFRKYNLDSPGFRKATQKLGKKLNKEVCNASDNAHGAELAAAYVMGRFKDGTPVTLFNKPQGGKKAKDNTFSFEDDKVGAKCPFHAHIRKMNPRNNLPEQVPYFPKLPIVRRGMNQKQGGTKTGFLFASFQGSIINQFEKLQINWGNTSWEPAGRTGVDILIGEKTKKVSFGLTPEEYVKYDVDHIRYRKDFAFPRKYGQHGNLPFDKDPAHYLFEPFESYIDMVGGEYFFMPSIPGLLALVDVSPPPSSNRPMMQRLQYIITRLWTCEKDLKDFKEDFRACMIAWLDVHMESFTEIIITEKKLRIDEIVRIEDGYVKAYLDISGKPKHLSDEEIWELSLEDFQQYNSLDFVAALVLFNPYFLVGW